MILRDYRCLACERVLEVLEDAQDAPPACCGATMARVIACSGVFPGADSWRGVTERDKMIKAAEPKFARMDAERAERSHDVGK